MTTLNKIQTVKELVASTQGKIFNVDFIKADGSLRNMTCRIDVAKYTSGGVAGWKSNDENVGVFEMNGAGGKESYRAFNAGRVVKLKIAGKEHTF